MSAICAVGTNIPLRFGIAVVGISMCSFEFKSNRSSRGCGVTICLGEISWSSSLRVNSQKGSPQYRNLYYPKIRHVFCLRMKTRPPHMIHTIDIQYVGGRLLVRGTPSLDLGSTHNQTNPENATRCALVHNTTFGCRRSESIFRRYS